MLRIAKLTDYAALLLTEMAAAPETQFRAAELAARARVELPTAAKVLKTLGHAGLVEARRGASGGYRLARPAHAITMADVVEAMEGPIGMTECVIDAGACGHEGHCGVQANWKRISQAVQNALREVSLADLLPAPPARRIPITTLAVGGGAG
jgi:FeS assembly SUF system regulator